MEKKLFIGGLAKHVSELQVREILEPFGEVGDVVVVYDRETGQSRGFGFATFFEEDEATAAIEGLDGNEFEGQRLSINEARPREDRPRGNSRNFGNNRGGYNKGGGGGGKHRGRGGGGGGRGRY